MKYMYELNIKRAVQGVPLSTLKSGTAFRFSNEFNNYHRNTLYIKDDEGSYMNTYTGTRIIIESNGEEDYLVTPYLITRIDIKEI